MSAPIKLILIWAIILLQSASLTWGLPAFPGAEGWGADTPGGRGGQVYIVTNLNSEGPGSLLEGILMEGPRIIVFGVSGVIELQVKNTMLSEANSFLTIAGQTSPGGITLRNAGSITFESYGIDLHDFVWRFLRFRGRNAYDGIQLGPNHHFIIDHCDFSGGEDETTDFYYATNFTVQWSTITNSETNEGKGTIIAGEGHHVTFHHNIWAHHQYRMPAFYWDNPPPDNGLIDLRNNIIFDHWGYSTVVDGNYGEPWNTPGQGYLNFVGNIYKEGANLDGLDWIYGPYFTRDIMVYDSDNCYYYKDHTLRDCENLLEFRYGADRRAPAAFATPYVTTTSADIAYEQVLSLSGALPKDDMNARTEMEIRTGTGPKGKVDDVLITSGPNPPEDSDEDGMPDFWETTMGFDPNDATDNIEDHDADGYTNIEEFLNDLAQARLCLDYHNPVYPIPENWPDYNPSCSDVSAVDPGQKPGVMENVQIALEPFGNGLRIIFPHSGFQGTLTLFNPSGARIMSQKITGQENFLFQRTPGMPPGIYLLHIKSNGESMSARVVFP